MRNSTLAFVSCALIALGIGIGIIVSSQLVGSTLEVAMGRAAISLAAGLLAGVCQWEESERHDRAASPVLVALFMACALTPVGLLLRVTGFTVIDLPDYAFFAAWAGGCCSLASRYALSKRRSRQC